MDSFLEFVLERLSVAGKVSSKAMFGGYGIYSGEFIFAIVVDGVLYLKVDDSNIKDYIQAGMKPFTYPSKQGKPISMSYWRLPIDILESNEDLPKWVSKAIAVAKILKTSKPKNSGKVKLSATKKKSTKTKSKKTIVKKNPVSKKKSTPAKKKKSG